MDCEEKMPKPNIDVEGLKRKELPHEIDCEYSMGVTAGWNGCIDHLQSQGHLNQGWQPIETAPKDGTGPASMMLGLVKTTLSEMKRRSGFVVMATVGPLGIFTHLANQLTGCHYPNPSKGEEHE